jgi:hypothetical protein
MRHQSCCRIYFLPAGSLVALWRTTELPSNLQYVASCLTSRAVPVEFHSCNDSVTRVAGNLRVSTMRSWDILHQAKGIILVESAQIRWFLRRSGRGGWPSRAIAQRRPRVSKLGLRDCPTTTPMRQQARQPDRGQWAK